MRLLIDTHVFLWMDDDPSKVSISVQQAFLRDDVEVFLSVVSLWEIAIKKRIGKLQLDSQLLDMVDAHRRQNGFRILPVTLPHVLAVEFLPDIHKDPFDRLLIGQAIADDRTIATADPLFADYPVRTIW
jgi:PIN domain nuclease of toxin-antitoxin system